MLILNHNKELIKRNLCYTFVLFTSFMFVTSSQGQVLFNGRKYVVAQNQRFASDNNPGTTNKAFITISKAAALAQPSDTVSNPYHVDTLIILPPQWVFGVSYGGYTNQNQTLDRVNRLIEGDYPIDSYWIDSWFWNYENQGKGPDGYLNFIGDTSAFPNLHKLWQTFEAKNIKAGIWIWNTILKNGNENIFKSFEDSGYFDTIYTCTDTWHNLGGNSLAGDIDFQNPDAVKYWKNKLRPFFNQGLDYLKLDRSAEIPYLKAAYDATSEMGKESEGRGYILSHVGNVNNPEYKKYPAKYTDDSKIAWCRDTTSKYKHEGLKENIKMITDPKRRTYPIPFLTNDAGGYTILDSRDFGNELFMRWIQFASFNSIMEVFSAHDVKTSNMPYNYSKKAQAIFKKYTHLRMQLFPYIYSNALKTRFTGQKMIHSDSLNLYQYQFGEAFLVAPIFEKNTIYRNIYLPPNNKWIDYWTKMEYEGGQTIKYKITDDMPLFVKAGSIIPMRNYARAVELGSNDPLILDIYPNNYSESVIYEDDGMSNDYLNDKIAQTKLSFFQTQTELKFISSSIIGNYNGILKYRTFILKINMVKIPKQVLLNGGDINFCKTKKDFERNIGVWYFENNRKTAWIKYRTKTDIEKTIRILY